MNQNETVLTEFDELKQILFGEERRHISALDERLIDPKQRARDMAEILPASIVLSTEKGPDLTQSLRAPVTECVEDLARNQTEIFAEALFPAIMPAIRRSIMETLRAFVQGINQTIDQSFSAQGVKWRLEAIRTGLPFHEIVLKHTLVYRVEQVFLIQYKTGVLIAHAAHPDVTIKDSDAISAMFTAIRDFVSDSFDTESIDGLDTIEIGGHTTWLIYSGPVIMLACVIRGIAPLKLRERLTLILEDIERRFHQKLINFQGDRNTLPELKPRLQQCLDVELKGEATQPRRPHRVRLLVLLTLFGMLISVAGYWLISTHRENKQIASLHTRLAATPGIVLTDSYTDRGKRIFRGLRDPLAANPVALAQSLGMDTNRVGFQFQAYHSMEEDLVIQRVNRWLETPDKVQLVLVDGTLKASGTASYPWIRAVKTYGRYVAGVAGVNRVDVSQLTADDQSLLQEATKSLGPPESVTLSVNHAKLSISGVASWAWIRLLPQRTAKLEWLQGLDVEQLGSEESKRLQALKQKIENQDLFFSSGRQLREDSHEELQKLVADLQLMVKLADKIGWRLHITLRGYTDAIGGAEINTDLRNQRAQQVLDLMLHDGLDPQLFSVDQGDQPYSFPPVDPKQRRVRFSVQLNEADLTQLFTTEVR